MKKYALLAIVSIIIFITSIGKTENESSSFHTDVELLYFKNSILQDSSLVDGWNALFAASGECNGCHGYDLEGGASVDAEGNDINVVDDWRATMMAMSAKDPFWRAKVSHEVLVTPELQAEIESSCTDCHAPLGFFNAVHLGIPHYTMNDLRLDSVGLDGVSCGACHQISPDSVGLTFSGKGIKYVEDTIFGQYEEPFSGPMESFVGFLPVYSDHVESSEFCAACHTLITETIGLDGLPNGSEFVEQATYHEWVNSAYNVEGQAGIQCQGCHMPRVDDEVKLVTGLLWLDARTPFYKHDIVGGNSFMLDMMKDHRDTLDIRASAAQLDSVKAATLRMLQHKTLDMELTETFRDMDSLFIDVELINKAGHKFPSAYPSRIAYVQFIALKEDLDTLFRSGILDSTYELINRDIEYEPHFDLINSDDQVQIYELVMGDELGNETTVLSQAEVPLKDNRLAPLGFSSLHFTYDTVRYYGTVLNDDDFNLTADGAEGSGKDRISYHIALDGYEGDVTIHSKVFYQVTPPRWLDQMFDHSSEDIDLFRWMYEGADKEPVEIVSEMILSQVSGISENIKLDRLIVYPNPTYDGQIAVRNIDFHAIDEIQLFDVTGKLIKNIQGIRLNTVYLEIPGPSGLYFLKVASKGNEQILKVLKK